MSIEYAYSSRYPEPFDRDLIMAPRKRVVQVLVGTDEVGRGCLAGPVVAAAVVLPSIDAGSDLALQLASLNDSKQGKNLEGDDGCEKSDTQ